MRTSNVSTTLRPRWRMELARECDGFSSLSGAAIADPLERIAAGCAAFIRQALRDPAWGALAARGSLGVSRRLPARPASACEDSCVPRSARTSGADLRRSRLRHRHRHRSAGDAFGQREAVCRPSDVTGRPSPAILRALGVAAEQADRIVRRLAEPPCDESSSATLRSDCRESTSTTTNTKGVKTWRPISSAIEIDGSASLGRRTRHQGYAPLARRLSDHGGVDRAVARPTGARQPRERPRISIEFGQDPFAGDGALPRLLPGRQLPPAHDRIRHGPGRKTVQHVLHQIRRVDQLPRRAAVSGQSTSRCSTTRSSLP